MSSEAAPLLAIAPLNASSRHLLRESLAGLNQLLCFIGALEQLRRQDSVRRVERTQGENKAPRNIKIDGEGQRVRERMERGEEKESKGGVRDLPRLSW
jgi:hypothetical protein